MTTLMLCLLALADPITPAQLNEALQVPPKGEAAEALAARIRAALPKGTDLKAGTHAPLVEGSLVAFVVEASPFGPAPRVTGMVNHGRGLDLVPVGKTGLWVGRVPGELNLGEGLVVGWVTALGFDS